jgi:aromatic ring hydroxylase
MGSAMPAKDQAFSMKEQTMRSLLIALGASLAMTGSAFAFEGGCAGSKDYMADAGKHSKPEATKTVETAASQKPAAVEAPAPVATDVAEKSTLPKKPS